MSGVADSRGSWLQKWRVAEPEMEFAEPFVPVTLRPRFRAWGSWLAEIEHSLLAPSAQHVAVQRLGWWLHELAAPAPQHPLALALADTGSAGAVAGRVVAAAVELAQQEASAARLDDALSAFAPLAEATAAAEAQLFGGVAAGACTEAVAAGLLARWCPRAESAPLARERLPLDLLARHAAGSADGGTDLCADLATALLQRAPAASGLPLYRALRWRFDCERLQAMAARRRPRPGVPVPSPWRATWLAWRTARQSAPTG